MRLYLVLFLFLASPALADACADRFRAGAAAFLSADAVIGETERALYSGLGWVTRRAVLARLEDRSAQTSACTELDRLRATLAAAARDLQVAQREFRLAQALCWGENRDRAVRNLDALDDSGVALTDLVGYLDDLQSGCGPPG